MIAQALLMGLPNHELAIRAVFLALVLCFFYCSCVRKVCRCVRGGMLFSYLAAAVAVVFAAAGEIAHLDVTKYAGTEKMVEAACLLLAAVCGFILPGSRSNRFSHSRWR